MKAVVLETKKNTAAVLREDGVVLKVRGTYTVGQTIELKEKIPFSFTASRQMRLAFTAVALVLALLVGGAYNYTTVQAAGYVTVDEGAGLELVLNRRNQVIEIRATDETGESYREQLEKRHIRGASLEEAVQAVNEIHQMDMKEKEPDTQPQNLNFHAVSDDERRQSRLNEKLEHINGEGRPAEKPAEAPGSSELPAAPEGQPAPDAPHNAGEDSRPENNPAGDRPEPPEAGMPPQP